MSRRPGGSDPTFKVFKEEKLPIPINEQQSSVCIGLSDIPFDAILSFLFISCLIVSVFMLLSLLRSA